MICDSPFYVLPSKVASEKVPVPCGKCPLCKQRRVNQWVFRLMEEEKRCTSSYFVTLTYDTKHVPITENSFMTLRKSDFQNFMKRLRKLCPGSNIKYYAAGEYGSKTNRPHYHAIIFNCPDSALFQQAWTLDSSPLGHVDVGTVTSDSVAYTLKYIDKSVWQRKHTRDDRVPEFSLMSKGLGVSYLSPAVVNYHRRNMSILYLTKLSGHRVAMPRYYRNKIWSEQERKQQASIVQAAVIDVVEKRRRDIEREYEGRMTYEEVIDSERLGRYNAFYSRLKNRKL